MYTRNASALHGLPNALPFDPSFNLYPPYVLTSKLSLAAYAIVIYDYFCTFQYEVELVWQCPWSMGLSLFFLNRYLPFVDIALFLRPFASSTISQEECLWLFPLTIWIITLGMIIPQVIIILRTYAIWGLQRRIYWILAPLSVITFSTMLAFTAWKTYIDYARLHKLLMTSSHRLPNNIRCQISAMDPGQDNRIVFISFFLTVFVSEAIIFVLTIIKAKEHISQTSHLWVNQLYSNGIIYCVCMITLSLVNSIVTFSASPEYQPTLLPLHRGLQSVFGNRVIFLILQRRKSQVLEGSESGPKNTGTLDLLTSVYTMDSNMTESPNLTTTRHRESGGRVVATIMARNQ